jgi:DNA-binding MarR family transcriptional regulator
MIEKIKNLNLFLKQLKEPENYPGFLLWQASNVWQRNMKNTLKPFKITFTQFVILTSLMYLAKQNKTINQKKLAKHAKLDIMTTSDVLKTLESKMMVTRISNPEDRRHNSIKITDKGEKLIFNVYNYINESDNKFFNVLGADYKTLINVLVRLIQGNFDKIFHIDR